MINLPTVSSGYSELCRSEARSRIRVKQWVGIAKQERSGEQGLQK